MFIFLYIQTKCFLGFQWYLGNLGVFWVIIIEIHSPHPLTFPPPAAFGRKSIIATIYWAMCFPCARHFASVISFISNCHLVRPGQWLSKGSKQLLKHTSSNPSIYLLIRLIGPARRNAYGDNFSGFIIYTVIFSHILLQVI